MTLIGAGQLPGGATHTSEVTAVRGSAFGYVAMVSLFGGPTQTRPCTDNSDPSTCGPAPAVTLPASGSATPITDSRPSGLAQFGPAILFSSGPLTVSTQGTLGPSGSTTSTANIERVNTSGNEVFTADNVSSTCTASGSGISASTTITNGVLNLGSGRTQAVPTNPAPNTAYEGTVDGVGDRFRYVFNEQISNPDGSLTVNAGHQYLLGPTARGDLIIGQSVCGVTARTVRHAADLSVSIVDTPDPVGPRETVTYEITVTNHGPESAPGVNVFSTLDRSRFLSASSSSGGGCTQLRGRNAGISCDLGDIAAGASQILTIAVKASANGAITITSSASSSEIEDPNPNNNVATETTTVAK